MSNVNEFTHKLNIRYPVIQAPMLGVTTPDMVAAISNAGGLGSLPVGGLSPAFSRELIRKTRELTKKPFAVNLFVYDLPDADQRMIDEMGLFLERLTRQYNIKYNRPVAPAPFNHYTDLLDVLVTEKVGIVSFTFGVPNKEFVDRLKQEKTLLIGTATCSLEAAILEQNGIDVIVAQGVEAGGHRGTFLHAANLPLIGSMSLIPMVVDTVKLPVIAAGGISDGRGIKAAFALGASAVQLGSAFLTSNESLAGDAHKKAILSSRDIDTVVTNTFTGRWARGIRNEFVSALETSGMPMPPYPFQMNLTNPLRLEAQKNEDTSFFPIWAGQSASRSKQLPAARIFKKLVDEAGLEPR
ncbi:nitronate monooxygenase [Segetibacter sp. 3557_3]|nr:nitronate monooxygenase [Segetibacter sp. 3557_3]